MLMATIPEKLRLIRFGPKCYMITAVWGLMNTTDYSTSDWRGFLARKGWINVPRVWD